MQKYNSKIWLNNYQVGSGKAVSSTSKLPSSSEPKKYSYNIKSVEDINSESSEAEDVDDNLEEGETIIFNGIDKIPDFLEASKNNYLKYDISLDRHEVNKYITNALNVELLGEITTEEQLYRKIITSYSDIEKEIDIIILKIREFNNNNKYEYYVDLDKIVYVLWFKEIHFVQNLIIDISKKLDNDLNICTIYTYLIKILYNEPRYTKYYVKILIMMISEDSDKYLTSEKLKKFFVVEKINKIYDIIRLVFSCDTEFINFLEESKRQKFEQEKENNNIEKHDNFNDIEKFEININKEKKKLLKNKKREFNLDNFLKNENQSDSNFFDKFNSQFINKTNIEQPHNPTIEQIISNLDRDIWFGFILFIYKLFTINQDTIQKINEITNGRIDKIIIDDFDDVKIPYTVDLSQRLHHGGANNKYFKQYLKYKEKYLRLKFQSL
jgi:hypothetical protein